MRSNHIYVSLKHLISIKCIINWWIYLIIIITNQIVFNVIAFASASASASSSIILNSNSSIVNCTSVLNILESRGIKPEDIPRKPINEIVLRYCELSSAGTCCTYNMEAKLAAISKLHFDKSTKESIGKLHSVLITRAQKFNEFFTQLLTESKSEFDTMFKRTYGLIYQENSYVFEDLFGELETYFARGKIDLSEAMDSFFNVLYQKLFTVLNSQYTFDDKYLGCISEHMKELKPFGDVPDKLSVQIKRSFVATRTYAQALTVAADVVKNMMNVRPNAECSSALIKMGQCGLCKGYAEKPCTSYCVNVAKGCLQYYNDLDNEWDNFVLSMEKVSERLLGPFNIVMVVEPINIKISEAIMNFQETGQEITKQVFHGCGRPSLGLQKRFVPNEQIHTITPPSELNSDNQQILTNQTNSSYKHQTKRDIHYIKKFWHKIIRRELTTTNVQSDSNNNNNNKKKTNKRKQNKSKNNDDSKEPILDKLIKDIRQKVRDSKKFWSNLPYQYCNKEEIDISTRLNESCWDGNTIVSNDLMLSLSTTSPTTPMNIGSITRQTAVVGNQLYYLKTAINHLRNAYNGQDVEWTDQEESYYGSGSGSGNGINYDDEDGSGLNSLENITNLPEHPSVWVNINNNGMNGTNGTDSKHYSVKDDEQNTIKSKASQYTKVSLRRTLVTFLLPIFVTWFGSIVSDLL